MNGDSERRHILGEIAEAFRVPRPGWFCNARHCCECAEHEAVLQSKDLDSLDHSNVGNAGWSPITMIKNPEGFKYFLPVLARLAYGTGQEYYLDDFLSQLRYDRIEAFTKRQRVAVESLLVHLAIALAPEIERCGTWPELEWTLRRVRGEPGPCTYLGTA
jgi:hypothetical protein